MSYYIELMRDEDVAEVSRVEHLCFTNPWPQNAYRRELKNSHGNYYIVLREVSHQGPRSNADTPDRRGPLGILPFRRRETLTPERDSIVGFAGMWVMFDEAHVTTIGLLPEQRGNGLGELLLIDLFREAMARGAEWLTLEVRVSNDAAQALYQKYGFTQRGVRRRYYSDNGEDAYIMWSPSVRDPEFVLTYQQLRAALWGRLGNQLVVPANGREREIAG